MSAPPTKKCPECGRPKAERVIGPGAGFLFKGSGFYITDYRSPSYKKAAEAETKSSSNGNGKSESASSEKKSSGSEKKAAKSSE